MTGNERDVVNAAAQVDALPAAPGEPVAVPPGFKPFRSDQGFIAIVGPLHFLLQGEVFKLGFRVELGSNHFQ